MYHLCVVLHLSSAAPRERFDVLVGKIGDLENEKLSLLETIKNASAATPNGSSKDAGKGGGGRAGGSAEALRERLKVKVNLQITKQATGYDKTPTTGLLRPPIQQYRPIGAISSPSPSARVHEMRMP